MFPQELVAEDDRVVARLLVTGVHTGAHSRMPVPTDRRLCVEQIRFFTLADGVVPQILGWDWPQPEPTPDR